MKVTTKKAALSGLSLLGAAVLLAGVRSAPEEVGDSTEAASPDFLPCMVSDAGGFDDKSFNQLGFEGATEAADELGVELTAVQSDSETDYAPNITNLVDQGCNLIVTVGFALVGGHRRVAAEANPDVELRHHRRRSRPRLRRHHRLREHQADPLRHGAGGVPGRLRGRGVLARPASSAPSAACNFPTVTIFMDGFAAGRRVLQRARRAPTSRSSAGTARPERRRSPVASRPTTPRAKTRRRASSTRTSTCSCRSVARSTSRPQRPSATPARSIAMIGVDADFYRDRPDGRRPLAHLDPQGHRRRHVRGGRRGRRQRRVRQQPVRRHARERGRRHRAVPRLRGQGRPAELQGELDDLPRRDHRGRDHGRRPTSPAAVATAHVSGRSATPASRSAFGDPPASRHT